MLCSSRTLEICIPSGHHAGGKGARGARYSVVAGSPPLHAFITASIPDVVNIRLLMISDFRLQIVTSHVEPIHRQVKTIRDIGLDRVSCPGNGAIHNVPFAR